MSMQPIIKTFTYSEIVKESKNRTSKISYFNKIAFFLEGGNLNGEITIINIDLFEKGMKPHEDGGFGGSFHFPNQDNSISVYYCNPEKLVVKNKSVVLKFGSIVDSQGKIPNK